MVDLVPVFPRVRSGRWVPQLVLRCDRSGVVGVAVIDRVWDLRSVDVAVADRDQVATVLGDVAAVRRWLDGVEVACAARLSVLAVGCPSMFPEQITATATRSSLRHGSRVADRAVTAAHGPRARSSVGRRRRRRRPCRRGHRRPARADPAQRRLLAGHGPQLAELAASIAHRTSSAAQLAALVRQIEADDGVAKLERQQRAVRLRTWIDKTTGMVRLSGEFDPDTGLALLGRLNNRVETLFHDRTPPHVPRRPARPTRLPPRPRPARPHHQHRHQRTGGGSGRAEMSIVIDLHTIIDGRHANSRVDYGVDGIDLPVDTIRRIDPLRRHHPRSSSTTTASCCRWAAPNDSPPPPNAGRLRAMYRWCAVPGCRTPVGRCEPHHCIDWDHGGHTDIDVLVPICKHHHDTIHQAGWALTLGPDRTLTITTPNGTTMTTGPPSDQWT